MSATYDPAAYVQFLTPGVSYNYGLNYTGGTDPTSIAIPAIQSYIANEVPQYAYTDIAQQRFSEAASPTTIKDAAGNTVAVVNPNTAGGRSILQSLGIAAKQAWGTANDKLDQLGPLNPIPYPMRGAVRSLGTGSNPISGLQSFITGNAIALVIGIILIAIGAYSLITSPSFGRGISNIKGVAALA